MKRTLVRKCARGAKDKGRTLVDPFSSTAENGAEFEEAYVGDVAMQVAGNHGQHAGDQRRAQYAGFFAERVAERDDLAGKCRRKHGISGRAESACDGFVESSGEQNAANSGFALGPGQRFHALPERRKRVCKSVVAVDACDFFDEVDFGFKIETPAGEGDLPCGGLRGVAGQLAAERGKEFFDGG